ncbi:MAG: MscL family protein [Gemmatimonadaceae bacterium]|nr:MscL family protein [Gemmatimonadaceae bacterium]
MMKEFTAFLKQYGVVGLAIAVIIGGKLNALVGAVVDGILMPIVGAATPSGNYKDWVLDLGNIKLAVGSVLGAFIDFVIVAFIVFWIAKKILKEETVAKK